MGYSKITAALFLVNALLPQRLFANAVQIDKAAEVEINKQGFNILSEGVKDFLNNGGKDHVMPQRNLTIPVLVDMGVSGLSFKADIERLALVPYNSGITFGMELKNLKISIGKMAVKNPVLPFLQNSCEGTEIILANDTIMPIEGDFSVAFNNQKMQIRNNSYEFHIDPHQFVVKGPEKCTGLFGIRSRLEPFLINKALASMRPILNMTTRMEIQALSFALQSVLNNAGKFLFPVSLPESKFLKATHLQITAFPTDFSLTDEGMRLQLGAKIGRQENIRERLELLDDTPRIIGETLGTFAINPALVSEMLKAVLREGSKTIELTSTSVSSDLAQLMQKREMAYFWPDLEKVQTDTEEMRFGVRLASAPDLSANWNENKLTIALSKVFLTPKIKQNGEWKNYFDLVLDLKLTLKAEFRDGNAALQFFEPTYQVSGQWANGYAPLVRDYNMNAIKEFVGGLLTSLTTLDKPMSVSLPLIPFGSQTMTLNNFRMQEPLIMLDLALLKKN